MNLYQKINDIKKAKEDDKLVIFVGAGVSSNSGIPNWRGLVQGFAKQLGYSKCKECIYRKKNKKCSDNLECEINADEYLKIPQYYYNEHKKKYYKIIEDVLDIEAEPNELNKIIMDIQPKHIITTNYDKLIENTKSVNRMIYRVIYQDKELINRYSNNYIIKMHGDIKDLKNIVLKEDDYLSYSQNHILIETMIKALLLDHTFLFVGYSLNDYNLKLIMKWRDIIADTYNKERCKSYIIDPIVHEKYEEDYLNNNGVYIINDNDINNSIVEKYSKNVKLNEFGRKIYSVLNMINTKDNILKNMLEDSSQRNLVDYLYNILQVFRDRKKIALCELNNIIGIMSVGEVLENTLVIIESNIYNNLILLLKGDGEKKQYINEIFAKAGILVIMDIKNNKYILSDTSENNDTLMLELTNNYKSIYLENMEKKNSLKKAYLFYICNPYNPEIENILLDIDSDDLDDKDIFNLLILKFNLFLCRIIKGNNDNTPSMEFKNIWKNTRESIKDSYEYLDRIFRSVEIGNENKKQFEKLEELYLGKKSASYYVGGDLYNLYKLKRDAYEIYLYCKTNYIMIDYFTELKNSLELYIKGILCTYTPQKNKKNQELIFKNELKSYELELIDLEMIVKYINYKTLVSYIEEYNVKELKFNIEVIRNIDEYFYNLCTSIIYKYNEKFIEYIRNYLLILSKCDLNIEQKNKVLDALLLLLDRVQVFSEIIGEIVLFIRKQNEEKIDNLEILLNKLFDNNIINIISETKPYSIQKLLGEATKYIDKSKFDQKVMKIILESKNVGNIIIQLHNIISNSCKKNIQTIINDKLNTFNSEVLFNLIVNEYISYDENIEELFKSIIEREIKQKIPGVHSYPDWLDTTLKYVVILHVLDKIDELSKFMKYKEYSIYLQFIYSPMKFDYKKIDLSDYMWRNLFYCERYKSIFLNEAYSAIKENLLLAIDNKYATDKEKSIYYMYFEDNK